MIAGGDVVAGVKEVKKDWQEERPMAANRSSRPITRRREGNLGPVFFTLLDFIEEEGEVISI